MQLFVVGLTTVLQLSLVRVLVKCELTGKRSQSNDCPVSVDSSVQVLENYGITSDNETNGQNYDVSHTPFYWEQVQSDPAVNAGSRIETDNGFVLELTTQKSNWDTSDKVFPRVPRRMVSNGVRPLIMKEIDSFGNVVYAPARRAKGILTRKDNLGESLLNHTIGQYYLFHNGVASNVLPRKQSLTPRIINNQLRNPMDRNEQGNQDGREYNFQDDSIGPRLVYPVKAHVFNKIAPRKVSLPVTYYIDQNLGTRNFQNNCTYSRQQVREVKPRCLVAKNVVDRDSSLDNLCGGSQPTRGLIRMGKIFPKNVIYKGKQVCGSAISGNVAARSHDGFKTGLAFGKRACGRRIGVVPLRNVEWVQSNNNMNGVVFNNFVEKEKFGGEHADALNIEPKSQQENTINNGADGVGIISNIPVEENCGLNGLDGSRRIISRNCLTESNSREARNGIIPYYLPELNKSYVKEPYKLGTSGMSNEFLGGNIFKVNLVDDSIRSKKEREIPESSGCKILPYGGKNIDNGTMDNTSSGSILDVDGLGSSFDLFGTGSSTVSSEKMELQQFGTQLPEVVQVVNGSGEFDIRGIGKNQENRSFEIASFDFESGVVTESKKKKKGKFAGDKMDIEMDPRGGFDFNTDASDPSTQFPYDTSFLDFSEVLEKPFDPKKPVSRVGEIFTIRVANSTEAFSQRRRQFLRFEYESNVANKAATDSSPKGTKMRPMNYKISWSCRTPHNYILTMTHKPISSSAPKCQKYKSLISLLAGVNLIQGTTTRDPQRDLKRKLGLENIQLYDKFGRRKSNKLYKIDKPHRIKRPLCP